MLYHHIPSQTVFLQLFPIFRHIHIYHVKLVIHGYPILYIPISHYIPLHHHIFRRHILNPKFSDVISVHKSEGLAVTGILPFAKIPGRSSHSMHGYDLDLVNLTMDFCTDTMIQTMEKPWYTVLHILQFFRKKFFATSELEKKH